MGEMYDPARLQVCSIFRCHSRGSPAVCDVEVLRLPRGSGRHPAISRAIKAIDSYPIAKAIVGAVNRHTADRHDVSGSNNSWRTINAAEAPIRQLRRE